MSDASERDLDRVDEIVLAVLSLTLHDEHRVWKSVDWGAMERLHERGLISNPRSKAKSVALSAEGLAFAKEIARQLFTAE